MAGTFEARGNGTYRLRYMYKGERYNQTVKAKNDREAQKLLAKFVTSIEDGHLLNNKMTYFQFAQFWMDIYVKSDCSPTTYQNYRNYLNNRILPYLADYKLNDINVAILRELFTEMKTWNTSTGKPLSRETYRKFYNIISGSLQRAYEWEKIPSNPCRKIPLKSLHIEKLPSEIDKLKNKDKQKIRSYNLEQYNNLISLLNNENTLSDDKNSVKKIVIETILGTGFCLEELAGLEWERDWDYKKSTLSINIVKVYIKKQGWIDKEPKANSRSRTIQITQKLNNLLYILRQEHPNDKYIFFDLVNFNSLTNWYKDFQIKNNVQPILTIHELRHTHATILLKLGAELKAVSKRLGHSSVTITIETYVEYLPEDEDNIVELLEKN